MKTNSWTTAGQAILLLGTKPTISGRKAPTHWLKFYEETVIESEARTAVMQLKSEA